MKPTAVRIKEEDLDKLKERGIDLARLVRFTIDKVLKTKTCPVCGHKHEKGSVK